ncbi:hypothetical protein BpHYR1_040453 [Brachionus plicatilis]|uniref:Uncharacterized protein n=1 Tax=Brachionus plicatilis TaxID=10195 RepID=A0A3M7S8C7_BRAPC|nr:hypothetical protein BpHYR1_040453 [Brachionus plicatilis]
MTLIVEINRSLISLISSSGLRINFEATFFTSFFIYQQTPNLAFTLRVYSNFGINSKNSVEEEEAMLGFNDEDNFDENLEEVNLVDRQVQRNESPSGVNLEPVTPLMISFQSDNAI